MRESAVFTKTTPSCVADSRIFTKTTPPLRRHPSKEGMGFVSLIILTAMILALSGCHTSIPDIPDNEIMDSFLRVMNNEVPFIHFTNHENGLIYEWSPPQRESMYLSEYLEFDEDHVFEIRRFAVVDMDKDGIPELIIESENYVWRLVLRYSDGEVYGYTFSYRGMNWIDKSGVFTASGGASRLYIFKLQFLDDLCDIATLAHYKDDYNNDYERIFFIGDEQVTEEEFEVFESEMFEVDGVEWIEYTQESFKRDFAKAWRKVLE